MEDKIDKLTEAVTRLVLIEERQTNQASRIAVLESVSERHGTRLTDLEHQQIKWQNRAIGVVLCVGVLWQFLIQFLGK